MTALRCINSLRRHRIANPNLRPSKRRREQKTIYLFMFFRQLNCELQSWLKQTRTKMAALGWLKMTSRQDESYDSLKSWFMLATTIRCATSNRRCRFLSLQSPQFIQIWALCNWKLIFYSNSHEKSWRFMQFSERKDKNCTEEGQKKRSDWTKKFSRVHQLALSLIRFRFIFIVGKQLQSFRRRTWKEIELNYLSNCSD